MPEHWECVSRSASGCSVSRAFRHPRISPCARRRRRVQFLTPATRGLALRYGIFVRADCWRERGLIAHELAHTAQYEQLGGIEPFLRQYLGECLSIGYPAAPMEQEAIAAAGRLEKTRPA